MGADLPTTSMGAISGGSTVQLLSEHSTTGECLFGRTFARRVIKRLTDC